MDDRPQPDITKIIGSINEVRFTKGARYTPPWYLRILMHLSYYWRRAVSALKGE